MMSLICLIVMKGRQKRVCGDESDHVKDEKKEEMVVRFYNLKSLVSR